jgi:hypothetical protein
MRVEEYTSQDSFLSKQRFVPLNTATRALDEYLKLRTRIFERKMSWNSRTHGPCSRWFHFFLLPLSASASTWYVNGVTGNDSSNCLSPSTACKTIRARHIIGFFRRYHQVAAASYTENLTISKGVGIIGASARTTIVDGGGVKRVINILAATVTLSGLTIRNGMVTLQDGGVGAGIANAGNLQVISSTITGNLVSVDCPSSICSVAAGGGVYNGNGATLTIRNSAIVGNTVQKSCISQHTPCVAESAGGEIYNVGALVVSNSTIAGNRAQFSGKGFPRTLGGGISNRGPAVISNTTFGGNSAMNGGGIFNYQGNWQVTLQNSIVANSSAGGNCAGTIVSNGFNVSSDNTCNFSGPGDMNNANRNLNKFDAANLRIRRKDIRGNHRAVYLGAVSIAKLLRHGKILRT